MIAIPFILVFREVTEQKLPLLHGAALRRLSYFSLFTHAIAFNPFLSAPSPLSASLPCHLSFFICICRSLFLTLDFFAFAMNVQVSVHADKPPGLGLSLYLYVLTLFRVSKEETLNEEKR